jgi:pimeloyl-ACP methyl ester carboxylesterase
VISGVLEDSQPTSDPEPSVLILPSGSLAYTDEGPTDGPPLFALHGIPGSVRDFRYLAPQLTRTVRFVRLDLPGFGASAEVLEGVGDLPGRFRVVLALADHLGISRFGLLGHSMGGGTALLLAAECPRVSLLVLVASLGVRRHRALGMPPRAFGHLALALDFPIFGPLIVGFARQRYRALRLPGGPELDAHTISVHFRAISAMDFRRLKGAARGPLPPTLVSYARDDRVVEREVSEELIRALPGCQSLVFDEGGHNLQKTRAVELGSAIGDLLARQP